MGVLTKDMAPKPALCRLAMLLRPEGLHVAITSAYPEAQVQPVFQFIPFQQGTPLLEAFEDCVYENPLLLSDFAQANLLIDCPRYLIVPDEAATDEICTDMLQAVWPDVRDFQPCPLAPAKSVLAMAPADGILAFARRTWLDTVPSHPLVPLADYFARYADSGLRLFAWLAPGSVHCLLFNGSALIAANSASAPTAADAAYFMLATANAFGGDHTATRFALCGNLALREEAAKMLRGMHCTVSTATYPTQAMTEAAAADAPFPIIATIYR